MNYTYPFPLYEVNEFSLFSVICLGKVYFNVKDLAVKCLFEHAFSVHVGNVDQQ